MNRGLIIMAREVIGMDDVIDFMQNLVKGTSKTVYIEGLDKFVIERC